jgi:hypothetical protein
VVEKIVSFEKLVYVDHQNVQVEAKRWGKHVKFKGYRREDLELAI